MTHRRTIARSLLLLFGLGLAVVLWNIRGTPSQGEPVMKPGAIVHAPITLVTVDRDILVCAMKEGIKGNKCLFSAPGQPADPVPDADKTLAHVLTTERVLFLVAGLFEQPAVRERYQQEPPQSKSREGLKRFTADCKLKLLGEVDAQLQWAPDDPWSPPTRVWAAVPVKCEVVER